MPITLKIDRKRLENLYLHKLLSSYQIAKKFRCSQATIMERLNEFGIKTRTIQQGKALTKPRYKRRDFDGTPEDKAYLIGFRLGDLHISKTHPNSPTIRVTANSTREEQIQLVRLLFRKYGHTKVGGPDSRGAKNLRSYLNTSFNFLLPKTKGVEGWILKSKTCTLHFFAGYVDAEGCFSINHRGGPVFAINSQDKEIMASIQSFILPSLSVDAKLHFTRPAGSTRYSVRSNKDVFSIFVYNKANLLKIINALLPILKHKKRKANALKILSLFKNNVRS